MRNRVYLTMVFLVAMLPFSLLSSGQSTAKDQFESSVFEVIQAMGADGGSEAFLRESYQKQLALPPEVVPWLTQRLKKEHKGTPTANNLNSLLTFKLRQYDNVLSKEVRAEAIDELVAECESAEGGLQRSLIESLRGLRDEKIIEMARKFSQDPNPALREVALHVLHDKKRPIYPDIESAIEAKRKESGEKE